MCITIHPYESTRANNGCLIPFTDDNAQLGWRTEDNIDPILVRTIGRMIDEYEQFDS